MCLPYNKMSDIFKEMSILKPENKILYKTPQKKEKKKRKEQHNYNVKVLSAFLLNLVFSALLH